MGETSMASSSSQYPYSSYLDLVYQRPNTNADDAPMRPLTLGWGLSPELYPPTSQLVYEPSLVPWLLHQFNSLLSDLPRASETVQQKLRDWRCSTNPGAYPEDGARALQAASIALAQDILRRHPAFSSLGYESSSYDDSDDVESSSDSDSESSTGPIEIRGGIEYHWKWFGLPERTPMFQIRIEPDNEEDEYATFIVPISQARADRYLPEVVRLAKGGGRVEMGVAGGKYDVHHFLQLVILLASESQTSHVLLTSYRTSLLLRLDHSHADTLIITCSDLITDCMILPALNASLQIACICPVDELDLYLEPPWNRAAPSIVELVPNRSQIPIPLDEEVDDVLPDQIILAFASLGSMSAHEHYLLSRAGDGTDDVDKSRTRGTELRDKPPLLVAFRQIGEGTCGSVYLAHYGRHRIAVKISPTSQQEERSMMREYEIYRHIRDAGLEGTATPRCFGLYRSDDMIVLLTAYAGYALQKFGDLDIEDRLSIFRAVKTLADAGIHQGSFGPRNVVCDEHNVFRIIDFHRGSFKRGRKADLEDMHGDCFHLEGEDVTDMYFETLELDWRHVVPVPESDEPDLLA